MKKVLLCAPSAKHNIGGISRWTNHILNHYAELTEKKIQLKLFDLERRKTKTPQISIFKRIWTGVNDYLKIIRDFKSTLSKNKFQVIHLVSSASFGLLKDLIMLNYARKHGAKSIIHFHFGRIPELFEKKNWEFKLLKRVLKKTDIVIVLDKLSLETLERAGYNHVQLLPNPLSPIINEIILCHQNIQRKERKILFAAHVLPSKGIYDLVEACKELPDIELVIIGKISDEIESKLKTTAGDEHDKWLIIKGEKDFEVVIREMLSAAVFVLPSYTEGFPNVIIESMACGCPIVATNVGGIPELLEDSNGEKFGICVEPGDVKQLTNALNQVLNNKEFSLSCAEKAKDRVNQHYSISKIWLQLEKTWITI